MGPPSSRHLLSPVLSRALAPFPLSLQTPEEERSLLHADSNGYTNLPDVVQPSHSPTESGKGQSPPSKEGGSDVSGRMQTHRAVGRGAGGHCRGWGRGWGAQGPGVRVCLTAAPPPQYQSRGLVKAPGKSSFTMFVDLGIYQPGGSGDTIPITGEDRRTDLPRGLVKGTGGPLMAQL